MTPRIVVVGSANVDLTTFADQMPRPGETIFAQGFELGFGGKGANQAFAARRCGAEVAMVARVGADLFGPATIENFRAQNIDTTCVFSTPDVSSGVAPIFVDSSGQNRILVAKGANDALTSGDVEAATDLIRKADFVLLQLEIPLETVYFTLRLAKTLGARTILNPAPAQPLDFAELSHVDFVIPNETEAEVLAGVRMQSADDARLCAQQLLENGVRRVIVTLGSNGSLYASRNTMDHVPAHPARPVDTTGAGDAFIGSLACFLAEGYEELAAVARANVYAALSTLSAGTQKSFPTRERFEAEWARAAVNFRAASFRHHATPPCSD
ncbi:MAG: ribokinase [Acidobacteriaceae bacterium]|nr:ribokinase [Acidobacteriaceae bacterium]